MKSIISILILSFSLFSSCGNPMKKVVKNTFGKSFSPPENFVYIPSGNLKISKEKEVSIQGFFMSKFEISNQQYSEFLEDLIRQGKDEVFKTVSTKTENFTSKVFGDTYPNHPAYYDYPVLAIPKEGAELYCQWMTEKLKNKYPNFTIKVRLPVEEEWIYAAKGGHKSAIYPWGDLYLRNPNGTIRANFRRIGASRVHFNREENKYELKQNKGSYFNEISLTAPVNSFTPNDYGLYHMSGNAAEMLATNSPSGGYRTKGGCYTSGGWDIRIDAEDEFEGWTAPSQYIGFRPVLSIVSKN